MTRVRNLQPGQRFILKRTGDRYRFVDRRHDTPSGTRHIVLREGCETPTTLHHSCHVVLIEETP